MNGFAQNVSDLPALLSGHLLISLCALTTAAVITLILAVTADRSEKIRRTSLAIAGTIQTIPGLALLALMVPLLGGTIGFAPAYAALTLYAILPMLQNSITGLDEIDPTLIEAARGLGMSERQILRQVRFPLALPVIIAGVRTATVWVVGMTTLATAVGANGLGTYIFSGLQTRNHATTLFGCFFAAALAVALDQALSVCERALRTRRYGRARNVAAVLVAAALVAVVTALLPTFKTNPAPTADRSTIESKSPVAPERPLQGLTITTGSKPFVESYILAELLALALESAGASVDNRPNMGSTILFDALSQSAVDAYVDYTGTIWTTIMKRNQPAPRVQTQIEVAAYLLQEHGIVMVGPLGFENTYSLAMRRDNAERLAISSIADLAGRNLRVGGDPEVFGRPEWTRVRDLYNLGSLSTIGMQAIYMFDAVMDEQVDVVTAYSTEGRIAAHELLVLEDPKQAFPPYDAILLASPEASKNPALIDTLSNLVSKIDDDLMRETNRAVEIDGETPESGAAKLWDTLRFGHHP